MSECKCDLRTKLVGDGCEVCNPSLALEYAKERIVDLEEDYAALLTRHSALVEAVKRLRNLEGGIPEIGMIGAHKIITAVARAEVGRLIANESAADCKGEG